MNIKDLIAIIFNEIVAIFTGNEKFTGKITFTINCRDGGIGNCNMNVEKNINKEKNYERKSD